MIDAASLYLELQRVAAISAARRRRCFVHGEFRANMGARCTCHDAERPKWCGVCPPIGAGQR